MIKKLKVTVGIPAYNEEKNLARLIDSIKVQKGNYVLEKLIVANDGSTDLTAAIVLGYQKKDKRIYLINGRHRLGKSKRFSDICKLNKSDILVTFDADVVLKNTRTIEELIKPLKNKKIGLIGGNYVPFKGQTFIEKVVITYEKFWSEVWQNLKSGNNVHGYTGCISAMTKELSEKLKIPENIIAQDHYIFFRAKELGFGYKFAPKAVVNFKVPNNLADYLKQTTRFITSATHIKQIFNEKSENDYNVPLTLKIKSYFKIFLQEPVLLLAAIVLQAIQRVAARKFTERSNKGVWTIIQSSK